jgi:hypothetical protein
LVEFQKEVSTADVKTGEVLDNIAISNLSKNIVHYEDNTFTEYVNVIFSQATSFTTLASIFLSPF